MSLYSRKQFFLNKNFNINTTKFCKATVGISRDRVRFLILNKEERKIEMFSDYHISAKNVEEYTTGLINLFESYKIFDYFLSHKIKIVLETDKFSLLPKNLFEQNDAESYLKFSCPMEKYLTFFAEDSYLPIAVAFGVREEINVWYEHISKKYNIYFTPSCLSIIKNANDFLEKKNLNAEQKVVIFISQLRMHISIFYRNELIFYNVINIEENMEIIISSFLNILTTLNLDRYTHEVIVFGEINKKSTLILNLKNYIKNIKILYSKSFFSSSNFGYRKMFIKHIDLF